MPRAHRRGVVVRGQFPTPRPPRQGTARAACPVRHRRPRRTRRYLSLLALLTQSALSRSLTSAAMPRRSILSGFPQCRDVGSGMDPQLLATAPTRVQRLPGYGLPSQARDPASALAGRLVAAAVNLGGESSGCSATAITATTSNRSCVQKAHTGVSFPTSSLCF
jgi:hypothetical protein